MNSTIRLSLLSYLLTLAFFITLPTVILLSLNEVGWKDAHRRPVNNSLRKHFYYCNSAGSCGHIVTSHTKDLTLFSYLTDDGWYSSTDFDGRLDYAGTEKIKIWSVHKNNKQLLPLSCSASFNSMASKYHSLLSCEDIFKSNHSISCSLRAATFKGGSLFLPMGACVIEPSCEYVHVKQATLTCKPYDYPTSKILNAGSCRFSLTLSDDEARAAEIINWFVSPASFILNVVLLWVLHIPMAQKLQVTMKVVLPFHFTAFLILPLMYSLHLKTAFMLAMIAAALPLSFSVSVPVYMILLKYRKSNKY